MNDEAAFAYFVFLPLWVIAGYLIGKSKGSPVQGAGVGCLLGPLGLAIILIFWRDHRPKCIYCKGTIEVDSSKCCNCGSRVPRCPKCKKRLSLKNRNECRHCGEELSDEDWPESA